MKKIIFVLILMLSISVYAVNLQKSIYDFNPSITKIELEKPENHTLSRVGLLFYFVMDGACEAWFWKYNSYDETRVTTWDKNFPYHLKRVMLRTGITVATMDWSWDYLATWILGNCLYKFSYNYFAYDGDILYNKTSKFMGMKHPPTWVWIPVFSVSLAWLIL